MVLGTFCCLFSEETSTEGEEMMSCEGLTSLQLLALGRQHSTLPLLEAAFPTTLLSAGECSGEIRLRHALRHRLIQ